MVFWKHQFLSKDCPGYFFGQFYKELGYFFNPLSGHTGRVSHSYSFHWDRVSLSAQLPPSLSLKQASYQSLTRCTFMFAFYSTHNHSKVYALSRSLMRAHSLSPQWSSPIRVVTGLPYNFPCQQKARLVYGVNPKKVDLQNNLAFCWMRKGCGKPLNPRTKVFPFSLSLFRCLRKTQTLFSR